MKFTKTYVINETGCQRNIYYYIDNKRVSCDKYYDTEVLCGQKGMQYNTSSLHTKSNGRTVNTHHYN